MSISGDPIYPEDDDQLGGLEPGFLVGAGRYSLKNVIGVGPSSVGWLASDGQLGEDLALKFYRSEVTSNPAAIMELRRETQQSRRLSHPNIVRLHDFCHLAGEPAFIAMEFVEGQSLRDLQMEQADQIFEWEQLKPLAQQMAAALDYGHGEGLMHGNLKPSNLLVDARGRLKLADFGLPVPVTDPERADMADSELFPYLSPQRLEGKPITPADDIYSLGACLYQFLGGKPPFWSGDIRHQIRHGRPRELNELVREAGATAVVPEHISALVMACLAKEPGHRPETAAAVADWISSEPVGREPAQKQAKEEPEPLTSGEPISLIPPETADPEPISLIPPEEGSIPGTSLSSLGGGAKTEDPWNEDEPTPPAELARPSLKELLANHSTLVAVLAGLLLLALGYYLAIQRESRQVQREAREAFRNAEEALAADQARRQRLATNRIIQLGTAEEFSYTYQPRRARGLDTNALNGNVKFWYEGAQRRNTSFIAPAGQTNEARGTITYQVEAQPGYRIQEMTIRQSSAIYTQGSIEGEYSVNGGKSFVTFYSTPPFQRGNHAGHARTAILPELNATNVTIRYTLFRFEGDEYNIQFLRDSDDAPAALEITGRVTPVLQD